MASIDFSSEFGVHAQERLESDEVIWLTTIGANAQPNPNPVWFIWRNDRIVILSQPATAKIGAIERNPRVALSFNSDQYGDNIVVFNGIADASEKPLDPTDAAAYLVKYGAGIARIGMTPEEFANSYSRVITVNLTRLRGWIG